MVLIDHYDLQSARRTESISRSIAIGITTNDDALIREDLAAYLNCGNQSSAIDFYGYNLFSWCGDSSFMQSGWQQRAAAFENYSVPVFLAEYGCNVFSPREFSQVPVLYGNRMTPVFSGGSVYHTSMDPTIMVSLREIMQTRALLIGKGLVNANGGSVSPTDDFENFSSQMASVSPSLTDAASYTPTLSSQAYPSPRATFLASTELPPNPIPVLCDCMMQTFTCVANPNITRDDAISAIFDACDQQLNICSGISANVTTGAYGAYSVCNMTARTSFAFNQCYNIRNSGSATCDFNGLAVSQQNSTSQSDTCSILLRQADAAGTGTITSDPPGATATRASDGAGTGPSKDENSSSTPGLSAGAKAGIGTGAALEVLALIVGIVLFMLRCRKKRGAADRSHDDNAVGQQLEKTSRAR